MNRSTQLARGHECTVEGCSRILKTTGSLARHLRLSHPGLQYYNARNRTPVHRAIVSPAHTPVAFSSPPHTPAVFPSPGSPHTPAVDRIEFEPLTPELDGIIPDPNSAPKAGVNEAKTKILHQALNGEPVPCDERGVSLQKVNGLFPGPPPPEPKAVDDWSPFESQDHFEMAEFLFCRARMSGANIDTLMEMIAKLRGGRVIFKDYSDIYGTIDSSDLGDVSWQCTSLTYTGKTPDDQVPEWMSAKYEIYYRNPRDVIKDMIADTTFKHGFDYVPYQEFDEDGDRIYENLMSGDWAYNQANIIAKDRNTHGSMFVPIILGSDKTVVSVATGHNEYWPLYMSIGNVHNRVRRARGCGNAVVLIGFLPIPKTDKKHDGSKKFREFRRQTFHSSLFEILSSLKPYMTQPEVLRCPDSYFRRVIYGLGPYIADYPEQVLLACVVQNWCPKCTANWRRLDDDHQQFQRTKEFTESYVRNFQLTDLWKDYGIVGNIVPFTKHFPRADIYELITPDLLHQLIKGTFKDHLVDWVVMYIEKKHRKQEAQAILADIDHRIAIVPSFSGIRRFPQGRGFKQWTGDDSKALMKVYLPAIEHYVPNAMLRCIRAFLEFCYIARHDIISERLLAQLKDALRRFHHYRQAFNEIDVSPGSSLPRQHSLTHYTDSIRLFGAPNGLCSSITEAKHVQAVKEPWRRTNRHEPLKQMLYINQRIDKLYAMRRDFTNRGMLEAAGLESALRLIEAMRIELENPDDAADSQVNNNGDANDEYNDEYSDEYNDEYNDEDEDETRGSEVVCKLMPSRVWLAKNSRGRVKLTSLASSLIEFDVLPLFHRFIRTEGLVNKHDHCHIDPKVSVASSATSIYYAPSDRRRTTEYKDLMRATPSWRKQSPRYDTILVRTELGPGPHGLSVAQLRFLFSFTADGIRHGVALVEWFSYIGESPDEDTGMWMVQRETRDDGSPHLDFICIDAVVRSCHLLPCYGREMISSDITHVTSLDDFQYYYVNKFADHHSFELFS